MLFHNAAIPQFHNQCYSKSCTSLILGAIKHLLSPCSLHGREDRSFGGPPVISQAPPFFIFWMDYVAEENHGNLCFSVKRSDFMMQKKRC